MEDRTIISTKTVVESRDIRSFPQVQQRNVFTHNQQTTHSSLWSSPESSQILIHKMNQTPVGLVDQIPPELIRLILSYLDTVEHLPIIPRVCSLFHRIYWEWDEERKEAYEIIRQILTSEKANHEEAPSLLPQRNRLMNYLRMECLNYVCQKSEQCISMVQDNEVPMNDLTELVWRAKQMINHHVSSSSQRRLKLTQSGDIKSSQHSRTLIDRLSEWVNSWFTLSFEVSSEGQLIGEGKCSYWAKKSSWSSLFSDNTDKIDRHKCRFSAKVITVGDNGVGISNLLNYLQTSVYYFRSNQPSNVHWVRQGIEVGNAVYFELYVMDDQSDSSVLDDCCVGSDCAIVCFALNDMQSFSSVPYWISLIRDQIPDCEMILVGLKADLSSERAISRLTARMVAKALNVPYLETSSVTGMNINNVFTYLSYICLCKNLL